MPITRSQLLAKLVTALTDADIEKIRRAMNGFSSFSYDVVKRAYRNALQVDPSFEQVAVVADKIAETSNWIIIKGGDKFRDKDIPIKIAKLATSIVRSSINIRYGVQVRKFDWDYQIIPHPYNYNSDNVKILFELRGTPQALPDRAVTLLAALSEDLHSEANTQNLSVYDLKKTSVTGINRITTGSMILTTRF